MTESPAVEQLFASPLRPPSVTSPSYSFLGKTAVTVPGLMGALHPPREAGGTDRMCLAKGTSWSSGEGRAVFNSWSTVYPDRRDCLALVCSLPWQRHRKPDVSGFPWAGEWGGLRGERRPGLGPERTQNLGEEPQKGRGPEQGGVMRQTTYWRLEGRSCLGSGGPEACSSFLQGDLLWSPPR